MSWLRKGDSHPPEWLAEVFGRISSQLDELAFLLRAPHPTVDFSPIVEVLNRIDAKLMGMHSTQMDILEVLEKHSECLKTIEKKPVILQVDATPGQHRRFGS